MHHLKEGSRACPDETATSNAVLGPGPCLLSCHPVPSKEKEGLLIMEDTKGRWETLLLWSHPYGHWKGHSVWGCAWWRNQRHNPEVLIAAPVVKKKWWKQRSTQLVREAAAPDEGQKGEESEEAAWPAARQEREETVIKEAKTTQSPSLNDLRDRQQVFFHQQRKFSATWLLQCWEGRKPRSWGPSLGTMGLTKGSEERQSPASLWRWFLASVKAS